MDSDVKTVLTTDASSLPGPSSSSAVAFSSSKKLPNTCSSKMGSCKNLEDTLEVLVISAQRKGKGMLFPKGGWEFDESMIDAALRESIEEARGCEVALGLATSIVTCNINNLTVANITDLFLLFLIISEEISGQASSGWRYKSWILPGVNVNGTSSGTTKRGSPRVPVATYKVESVNKSDILLEAVQGGKYSRIVNCILAVKSSYNEWKKTGGNGTWKFGGTLKPATPSNNKHIVRKNSDPFTDSLSRKVAKVLPSRIWGDKCPKLDIVINQGPTSPLPSGIPTYTVEIVNTCTTTSHIIPYVLLMFIFHFTL
ncbi:hypothetical protein L6452_42426 [Arctium lappa]|uniref:Uncharacterized protein n=1 Tax=Arctium lappa TaxID=4217 RepID=A0ACB8XHQ7_ARCLA|nr:hypothetical protein L6452_42426 [Arctium lappa]